MGISGYKIKIDIEPICNTIKNNCIVTVYSTIDPQGHLARVVLSRVIICRSLITPLANKTSIDIFIIVFGADGFGSSDDGFAIIIVYGADGERVNIRGIAR